MINKNTFEDVYNNKLTSKQKEVLPLFLAGKSDEDIADKFELTRTAITHRIRKIASKFRIDIVKDTDYKNTLVEIFIKYKPELVTAKCSEKYGFIVVKVPYPQGAETLNSSFYVEREKVEQLSYNLIQEKRALIRIKAPRQMGKTSLIKRIILNAQQHQYYSVYLNFDSIDQDKFNNPYEFLRSFYTNISKQISDAPPLQKWDQDLGIKQSCSDQFEELLQQLEKPLVLVLDEVDKVFEFSKIYNTFCPMLRNWHEQGSDDEDWKKLRIVLTYSTDDYGKLGIHQSPFKNVGIPIELNDFKATNLRRDSRQGKGLRLR